MQTGVVTLEGAGEGRDLLGGTNVFVGVGGCLVEVGGTVFVFAGVGVEEMVVKVGIEVDPTVRVRAVTVGEGVEAPCVVGGGGGP